jgi:hypothetical protein
MEVGQIKCKPGAVRTPEIVKLRTLWLPQVIIMGFIAVGVVVSLVCLRVATRIECTRAASKAQCTLTDVAVMEPTVTTTFTPTRDAVTATLREDDGVWVLQHGGNVFKSGVTQDFAKAVVAGLNRFTDDEHMDHWEMHRRSPLSLLMLGAFLLGGLGFVLFFPMQLVITIDHAAGRISLRANREDHSFAVDSFRDARVERADGGYSLVLFAGDHQITVFKGGEATCQRAAQILNKARGEYAEAQSVRSR